MEGRREGGKDGVGKDGGGEGGGGKRENCLPSLQQSSTHPFLLPSLHTMSPKVSMPFSSRDATAEARTSFTPLSRPGRREGAGEGELEGREGGGRDAPSLSALERMSRAR